MYNFLITFYHGNRSEDALIC